MFMLFTMVPKMRVLAADCCTCFSVCRELKNASWMRNSWFAIVVYVNVKQFSSLNATGMTHMCTGV